MSFSNIENFLQNGLNNNGARPSRFLCQLTPPGPLVTDTAALSKFTFTCRAASIPEYDVGIVNAGYFGRIVKLSGDRTWENWNTTVLLDEDYATRNLFEAWSNGINDVADNTLNATYFPYKGTMNIIHLSQLNNGQDVQIGLYTLVGVWPSRVGPIQLSWNQQNTISEYNVQFAFDNCIVTPQNTISPTTGQNTSVVGPVVA